MENVQKKKIKIAVAVSVVSVVLIVLVIIMCILFVPRKLSDELPLENIDRIEIKAHADEGGVIERQLTEDEIKLFIDYAKNAEIRYYRGSGMIKGRGPIIFDIYYKDGSSASFQQFRMNVKDKDGDFKVNSELAENDFDFVEYYKTIFGIE